MTYRKFSDNRKAYAVHRAGLALDRLLKAETPEEKRRAMHWATAWCVAGGGRTPARFSLRPSRRLVPGG